MIGWIVISVLIILALIFLKFDHHTRTIKIIALLLISFLIYLSLSSLLSSGKVDVSSPKGIIQAIYLYFGWMGQTIGNLWGIGSNTVSTVGHAVKMNITNSPAK